MGQGSDRRSFEGFTCRKSPSCNDLLAEHWSGMQTRMAAEISMVDKLMNEMTLLQGRPRRRTLVW